MNDLTLPLSGLSSVGGKSVVARFDGGMLSSDSGVLALAEVEKRLRVADRLARCIDDPRSPDQVIHNFADMIGFRMKMIAAGYEDGNDANRLRSDPVFKMAQDAPPSGRDLASQSTMCRLENLPDVRSLLAMGRTMVDLYYASFRQIPKRIVLDIDDTFDAVHGNQQLRLFNAHHDEYGFQPIVVFDGDGRFVAAVLRPAKRPSGAEIRAHLRRLVRAIRSNWPNIRILIRADGHYCSPQIIDWCRANDVDFILGVPPTTTLRKHVADLEARTTARFEASPKTNKVRRFKEFLDGAASWSRVERIIARVEVGAQGADTRFIVTNLAGGKAKALYEDVYCRRGAAENHIVLEDASRRRPNVLHKSDGQPVPAVPACRRLLAHVGPARCDAETLQLCRRAIRHAAFAPHQDRCAGGRDEDANPPAPADILPRPTHPAHRPRSHSAARDITMGRRRPETNPPTATCKPHLPSRRITAGA
ncbi:transposase [Mesorhizobium sp. L103C119B0]|nr:transposase [Mesorhizobium sp. L103C119B0]